MNRPVKRPETPDLVLVCRANRARSPIAADLLRQYALEQHIRPLPVLVSSGIHALRGQTLLTTMQAALKRQKRPYLEHRSKPFSLSDADAARLVITFEREFTRNVVSQNPALVPRTFTLREIVRLTSSDRWNTAWNGSADLGMRLHAIRPLVEPGDDDTPDPIGGGRRLARRVLDGLVADVALAAPVLLGQ